MLENVNQKIKLAETALERERGVVDSLASRASKALELAEIAAEEASAAEQAALLLNRYADERQQDVIHKIESLASLGLSQVFDEPMELKIKTVQRARRTEMDVTVKTGSLETPILEARGGGLAAVAGFLLRVSVLLLTPEARRLLVLDEVFAMLSEDYLGRLSHFISELCERTGLQIMMVSHQPEFSEDAHKVFRIERVDATTSRFVEEN